jgi:hypothetical protein
MPGDEKMAPHVFTSLRPHTLGSARMAQQVAETEGGAFDRMHQKPADAVDNLGP